MVTRGFLLALACCACAPEAASTPQPLVPEAQLPPSSTVRPAPLVRSFETKTIGGDPYPLSRATRSTGTDSSPSRAAPRHDAWSPTHVYGNMNPNPPGPGTPLYGDLNPSPPGPSTPRYGDSNPSPEGR